MTVKRLYSQCANGSQGASQVHTIQEVLSIMNYCKAFVFTVCKWVTGSVSDAQCASGSQGASQVHSVQEVLSIMNYCKAFVFTVCKWVTECLRHTVYKRC